MISGPFALLRRSAAGQESSAGSMTNGSDTCVWPNEDGEYSKSDDNGNEIAARVIAAQDNDDNPEENTAETV